MVTWFATHSGFVAIPVRIPPSQVANSLTSPEQQRPLRPRVRVLGEPRCSVYSPNRNDLVVTADATTLVHEKVRLGRLGIRC